MAEMSDSGWKLVKSSGQSYLVRRCFSIANFKVQLTDHRRLWSAEGTASELLQMSQAKNPLCEFNLSKVTQNIFNVFDKSLDSLKVEGSDNTSKILTMSTSVGNRPFNLVWTLTDQGPDDLYEEVTGPLLSLTQEMGHREGYLCKVIKEKDMEITDHLEENGPLKWGRIKTEKFNQEEYMGLFTCHKKADHISSTWETKNMLSSFNKNVFSCKKSVEDNVKSENPSQNEVTVKQEEAIPENDSVVEPKSEVMKPKIEVADPKIEAQVKEEKVEETSKSKVIQPKRKKVKLNL